VDLSSTLEESPGNEALGMRSPARDTVECAWPSDLEAGENVEMRPDRVAIDV